MMANNVKIMRSLAIPNSIQLRPPRERDLNLSCVMCKENFTNVDELAKHESSRLHLLKKDYRSSRKNFPRSVPWLEITEIDLDKSLCVNEEKSFVIEFRNVATECLCFRIVEVYELYNLEGVGWNNVRGSSIPCGNVLEFELTAQFSNGGLKLLPLVFEIETSNEPNQLYHILLEITFEVMSKELKKLAPVEPYQPVKNNNILRYLKDYEYDLKLIQGENLYDCKSMMERKIPLLPYFIPKMLRNVLLHEFKSTIDMKPEDNAVLEYMRILFCDEDASRVEHNRIALTPKNYVQRFQHLLWFEEHQMFRDMLLYNQPNARLLWNHCKNLFELKMPGLSEGRPSILKGDKILVKEHYGTVKFEGVVHVVEEAAVYLGFDPCFKESNVWKQPLNVEFSVDRSTLRMCHRALMQIQIRGVAPLMFPSATSTNGIVKKNVKLKPFFNKKIENNEEQKRAIINIIENSAYPAPYILFGPPGTGKTATIVEAIAQIWHIYGRQKKVCVCAPSNSAADLITERLMLFDVPAYEIFRIYALSRSENEMPEKLKKCSNYDRTLKELFFPSKSQINNKSIVVMTPMTAGKLVTGGFSGGAFHYLFMDEAGHAVEPEMIVPIIGFLTTKNRKSKKSELVGNLILAGDPKQLGPVVRSTIAKHIGLDMSLLERLMEQSKLYQKDPVSLKYNSRYITKLVHNYRSHSAILHVPNMLFYGNELVVSGDAGRINRAASWSGLEKPNFPILFHGVRGAEEREGNSPSYFNRYEIDVVGNYLRKLVNRPLRNRLVTEQDIGIITPYRKQVQKIKRYLRDLNMPDITVASVEEFQGQEKLIIIITTVRSRQELVPTDYQFGLGFLRNAKRFNVAVTRAVALLIVVGNPDILQCDPNWRALLEYCRDNDSLVNEEPSGALPPDFDPSDVVRLNLSALTINASHITGEESSSCFPEE